MRVVDRVGYFFSRRMALSVALANRKTFTERRRQTMGYNFASLSFEVEPQQLIWNVAPRLVN
jgi:hypothetical protein